jgi:glutamate 5-kinase
MDADLLVILSDVDRLIGPSDPLRVVTEITPEMERAARGTTRAISTGGMRTKLEAAKIALASGIPMALMNGRNQSDLADSIFKGEDRGTWFLPEKGRGLTPKQRWLALTGKPKGVILVDAGAREALVRARRSLLASGIQGMEGHFRKGDLVGVQDETGREFARGLVNYPHGELERIRGLRSEAIARVLGRRAVEVIHRDSLVILKG